MAQNSFYKRIRKKDGILRYYQVSQQIKEAIKIGCHKKGEKIPSERKLEELFGVSKTTIRRALDDLEKEGLIRREWGSGVYIAKELKPRDISQKVVGLTVWQGEDLSYHPATIDILRGINKIAALESCMLEIISINSSIIKNNLYEEVLRGCSLDGLLLTVREIPDEHIERIRKLVPRLVLNRYSSELPFVAINFVHAGYELTTHLLKEGHTRISYLSVYSDKENYYSGFHGYRKSLADHGIKFDERLTRFAPGSLTIENGFNLACEVLSGKEIPTAIIAGDNFAAIGVKKALDKFGISCPREVSLASFTNFPFTGDISSHITTVQVPFIKFGEEIMKTMVDLIKGKRPENKKIKMPLVLRPGRREPALQEA